MKSWPHAPLHFFNEKGAYMVTGSTYNKELFFKESNELTILEDLLLELAIQYKWSLEAWSVFPNHYHFVAQSPDNPTSLKKFITHLHASSARKLNELHKQPGRKIWYQYWDSRITFQSSYLARLNYVMNNPVKHKLITNATQYEWCSASWFENNSTRAYFKTINQMNVDSINIVDDF